MTKEYFGAIIIGVVGSAIFYAIEIYYDQICGILRNLLTSIISNIKKIVDKFN